MLFMDAKPFTPDSPEKNEYQARIFSNRLAKQYRILRKWARKNGITCYRLYDKDIPEIPLALDLYTLLPEGMDNKLSAIAEQNEANAAISANGQKSKEVLLDELSRTYIHLYLYERPYEKDEKEEEVWLSRMADAAAKTIGISAENVITKRRKRIAKNDGKGGRTAQYSKLNEDFSSGIKGIVFERGQIFNVNLTDYIDTGLFLDHRPLRDHIRTICKDKSVLNLFCYTASFSVYAAEGGASFIESVDTSNTYLLWAQDNMKANGFDKNPNFIFTREDVIEYLDKKNKELDFAKKNQKFDIIILDPPTFSNSKRSENTLDINRDWPYLVKKCLNLLNKDGILFFSTNSRRLSFSNDLLPKDKTGAPLCLAEEITASTIPNDFHNSKIHRVWKIKKAF